MGVCIHTYYICMCVYVFNNCEWALNCGVNLWDEVRKFGTIQTLSFVLVNCITQHIFPLWSTGAIHKSGGG